MKINIFFNNLKKSEKLFFSINILFLFLGVLSSINYSFSYGWRRLDVYLNFSIKDIFIEFLYTIGILFPLFALALIAFNLVNLKTKKGMIIVIFLSLGSIYPIVYIFADILYSVYFNK